MCVVLWVRVIGLCNAESPDSKSHDQGWDWTGSGLCIQELESLKLETRKGIGNFVVFARDVFCPNEYVMLQG